MRVNVSINFETNDDPGPDDLAEMIRGWGLPEGAIVNAGVMPPPVVVTGTVAADGDIDRAQPLGPIPSPEPGPEPEPEE